MIKPFFDFDTNADSVLLYESSCKIVHNNKDYIGTVKVIYDFLPKDIVKLDVRFDDFVLGKYLEKQNEIEFFINDEKLDILIISQYTMISKNNSLFFPLNAQDVKNATSIMFHIFNFYDLKLYNKIQNYTDKNIISGGFSYHHIEFEYKDYLITIHSIKELSDSIKAIQEKGISRLTYVGKINRKDKNTITLDEYQNIAELLEHFLSFIKGSTINLSCAVGLNSNDEALWYQLNQQQKEWKNLNSCFHPNIQTADAETILQSLFSSFANLWEKEEWKETLHEAIYWFLSANDGERGIDAGLILVQTAIERLSFEYVVNSKKLLSSDEFKKLRASDKFRILFSSLKIPLNIPNELDTLTKKAKNFNWTDAPHALTEIRNSLIHPEHKKHGKFDANIYHDAWNLSLWYLEISILALCRYDKLYSNRIKNIEMEEVPYLIDSVKNI